MLPGCDTIFMKGFVLEGKHPQNWSTDSYNRATTGYKWWTFRLSGELVPFGELFYFLVNGILCSDCLQHMEPRTAYGWSLGSKFILRVCCSMLQCSAWERDLGPLGAVGCWFSMASRIRHCQKCPHHTSTNKCIKCDRWSSYMGMGQNPDT